MDPYAAKVMYNAFCGARRGCLTLVPLTHGRVAENEAPVTRGSFRQIPLSRWKRRCCEKEITEWKRVGSVCHFLSDEKSTGRSTWSIRMQEFMKDGNGEVWLRIELYEIECTCVGTFFIYGHWGHSLKTWEGTGLSAWEYRTCSDKNTQHKGRHAVAWDGRGKCICKCMVLGVFGH